ncbi:MAG TPA: hypothetical protein VES88_09205 [Gemmatimonadaceae bacterium]|nr:hypothetical protein [Gemmatimonadaceae bacterium]
MVAAMPQDNSLGDALVQHSRRASIRRLTLDATGGLLTVALAAAWRPPGWIVLVSAALCFAAFGAWALADRVLEPPGRVSNSAIAASLVILRTVAIAVGIAAFLILVFGSLEIAMGTFIH